MGWIELHPHDPAWRDYFESERDRIRDLAGDELIGIFHIGSTSIPGLVAKPSIDILAVYSAESAIHAAKESFPTEYRTHRDEEDRVVLIWDEEDLSFTVHLRPRDAEGWRDQLVFRELLRDDSRVREKYEGAKRAAASEYPNDGKAYTSAKEPIIRSLTERAYERGYDERLPDFATEE
jgi:GrpB-like predicted nucleotidyltransferase (UPF0157 family)